MEQWLVENSFNLFGTFVGTGLFVNAYVYWQGVKAQRVANGFTITAGHRSTWAEYLKNEKLSRILDVSVNIKAHPVTDHEHVFVNLVILHTKSVFYANKEGLVIEYERLHQDVREFLSLPIPAAVWQKTKLLQNHDFVAFVESALTRKVKSSDSALFSEN